MANTTKTNLGIGRGKGRPRMATQDNTNQRPHVQTDNVTVLSTSGSLQNSTSISQDDVSTFDPGASSGSLKHSRLSAEANEFYPRNYNPDSSKVSGIMPTNLTTEVPTNEEKFVLLESVATCLSDIVSAITVEPGTYESAVRPFLQSFGSDLTDSHTLSIVLDIIIEQSIVQPNFRYNGARLCNELSEFLSDSKLQFRTTLLHRCEEEVNSGLKYFDDDPVRVQGLVCFLAELYIQLKLKPGTALRINILRDALYELLERLVSSLIPDNIKCVCKTLKLAGYALDKDNSEAMDALLRSLQEVEFSPTTANSTTVVIMIRNIEQLRRSSWGTNNLIEPDVNVTNVFQQVAVEETEPVFYGPDGIVLTNEESAFLQENFAPEVEYYDGPWTNGSHCEYENDGEMNEEEEAAYEEFLKMTEINKNR